MTPASNNSECIYELPLASERTEQQIDCKTVGGGPLPEPLLLENVFWFCKLRWSAVVFLTLFGLLSLPEGLMPRLGLAPPSDWPFAVAFLLAVANLFFVTQPARRSRSGDRFCGLASLWSQITFDLLVLTAVVHYTGTRDTSVCLAYLFHIVLACIFFSRIQSFIVTLLACTLFTLCIVAERTGVVPPASVYALSEAIPLSAAEDLQFIHRVISIEVIWFVVWYLASHLSALVRIRDCELAETNQKLISAQQERTRHLLLTTHELKAPFAAIHANTQLLLKGYCGVLPDKALDVVLRIAVRARRLGHEIQDMLQLANLRAPSQQAQPWTDIDLARLLTWCVDQTQARAQERGVTVEYTAPGEHVVVQAVEDHLKMLFTNLLTNAINYSHEGSKVLLSCVLAEDGVTITVSDSGIGIHPDKLPRIFDEHYRTDEAVEHCRDSTGLGLSIVRHVARDHGLLVSVKSQVGAGTEFKVVFPGGRQQPAAST